MLKYLVPTNHALIFSQDYRDSSSNTVAIDTTFSCYRLIPSFLLPFPDPLTLILNPGGRAGCPEIFQSQSWASWHEGINVRAHASVGQAILVIISVRNAE